MLECELHATFRWRVTYNFWNAIYMPRFDVESQATFGMRIAFHVPNSELHANIGMRVTCNVSTASHMQLLECELHATFRRRVTRNFWNASYMTRFDSELHADVGLLDLTLCYCLKQQSVTDRDTFLVMLNVAFEGEIHRDGNLKSQMLHSYHHIMGTTDEAFRSKTKLLVLKRGWTRPCAANNDSQLSYGESHATFGLRVTCHVSAASYT